MLNKDLHAYGIICIQQYLHTALCAYGVRILLEHLFLMFAGFLAKSR